MGCFIRTADYRHSLSAYLPGVTRTAPAPEGPPPAPPKPSYQQRTARAATGDDARQAASLSLARPLDDLEAIQRQDQISSLRQYRGQAYININQALRREQGAPESLPEWLPQIGDIDAAMADSRLTRDVVTYRGLAQAGGMFGDDWDGSLVGAEWIEHAYVSTTTASRIAENFAGEADGALVIRMLTPRGVGGIELSDAGYESELLLERGLTMRVVSDTGPGTVPRRLDVEVIP